MSKLVFVEGVSGVGKSTAVSWLSDKLTHLGYCVRTYLEGDSTNPIDFYSTACLSVNQYRLLCNKYTVYMGIIKENTVAVNDIRLIRYYSGKSPLFPEPLFSELMNNEFCYHPKNVMPIEKYTSIYASVWDKFQMNMDEKYDFILFDGSLLHHPINDLINNYQISPKQAVSFVSSLLLSITSTEKYVFYLKTNDIKRQLCFAEKARCKPAPKDESIAFWNTRYVFDMAVLNAIADDCRVLKIFDVSDKGWQSALNMILNILL